MNNRNTPAYLKPFEQTVQHWQREVVQSFFSNYTCANYNTTYKKKYTFINILNRSNYHYFCITLYDNERVDDQWLEKQLDRQGK